MKGQQVVLGHIGNAKVAALLVDGILHDVLVEDLNRLPLSSLLRAVVDRPVKGIGGVILRLPNGTGFLKRPKDWPPVKPSQCRPLVLPKMARQIPSHKEYCSKAVMPL